MSPPQSMQRIGSVGSSVTKSSSLNSTLLTFQPPDAGQLGALFVLGVILLGRSFALRRQPIVSDDHAQSCFPILQLLSSVGSESVGEPTIVLILGVGRGEAQAGQLSGEHRQRRHSL